MKSRVYRILGLVIAIIGALIIIAKARMTGFVISSYLDKIPNILGISLIFLGLLISTLAHFYESKPTKGLEVLISNKAVERSRRDRTVKSNLKQYRKEIEMIMANPRLRPQEILGEFHVSPRGHKDIRIAWHYDSSNNILYVDDLLYHVRANQYVDNWNDKAKKRIITKQDYEKAGYQAGNPL